MRTTVVLEDDLESRVRELVPGRKISLFINQCIRDYFEKEEEKSQGEMLKAAYERANSEALDLGVDSVSIEEWPEW